MFLTDQSGNDPSTPPGAIVQPLSDLRVLALEQYGAGPWGTLQLADLGADVIKVEDPVAGGDVARYVPPYQEGECSLFFETFNRNKRSISLDLRQPDARGVLEDLVRNVDVVFSNLRGDQPEALGLLYRDLGHLNARIVCCSLSGFGTTGPRAGEGGYDFTIQGIAGWQSITGAPGGPPTKTGLSLVDFSAGYVASIAILAAVWQARRDGVGCDVDLSLWESALAQLTYLATWVASRDYAPARQENSAHPSLVPFQNFSTADGWIVVACPKERLWRKLCLALSRPDLGDDPRFDCFEARGRNRDQLVQILEGIFQSDRTDTWLDALTKFGVPCAPVNDIPTALADEQAQARGALVDIDHPVLGGIRQVASPLRLSRSDVTHRRAPFRGEHTGEVLSKLCGYTPERLSTLAAKGVFGCGAEAGVAAR